MNRSDQSFAQFAEGDWCQLCQNEYELLTALLLDTRTPLERVRKVVLYLKERNLLDYRRFRSFCYIYDNAESLHKSFNSEMAEVLLRNAGYPWAKQKSVLFNQDITFDLKTASLEQIDSIKGIGPKLAALWMRIMHPERMNEFVVIDTHVRRWLRGIGVDEAHTSYEALSAILREEAQARGITITELDEAIVQNGINKRRGLDNFVTIPERMG